MSNFQEIAETVFNASVEAGKSRDETIITMVQEGLSLNMAQNVYKDLAKAAGMTKGRVGHKAEALVFIAESGVDVTDEPARLELKGQLAANFEVSPGTAHDYIRAYAAQEDIDLGLSNPIGQSNEEIFAFIAANPLMDKPAFRDFMEQLGRSKGNIDETWRGIQLAKRLITENSWGDVVFTEAA